MIELETNISDAVSSPKADATINASGINGQVKVEVWYKDEIRLKTTASLESEINSSLRDIISIPASELAKRDDGITNLITTARTIGFGILHRNTVRQHMDQMGERLENLRQK